MLLEPDPRQQPPSLDLEMARGWLDLLHGDSPGLVHVCASGNWAGQVCQSTTEAVNYVATMEMRQAQGIYLRATTVKGKLAPGSRGGEADSRALPGLWADVDLAGPGHRTDKPLPEKESHAWKLIEESGLPEPTLWIHSGGGLYPWWLLHETFPIEDEEALERARMLSVGWHRVIAHSASKLGWHYGTEVADLSRVLRIPGTVNRKVPEAPRLATFTDWGNSGRQYRFEELLEAMEAAYRLVPPPEPVRAVSMAPATLDSTRPGDDFEKESWNHQLLLGGAGWEVHHHTGDTTYWTRPDKDRRSGWSATTGHSHDRDRLFVFSSSTPFDPYTPYTKFGAYALLHHGEDYKAATKELARVGYGDRLPEPAPKPEPMKVPDPSPVEGTVVEGEVEHDPDQYFVKGGFNPVLLAQHIFDQGPVALGGDNIFWSYQGGVWRPDRYIVQDRGARLLGHKHRHSHITNTQDTVRAYCSRITCDPVSEYINFRNGQLRWRTGELVPHNPEDRITVQLAVDYSPDNACPQFDKFLAEVVPLDMVDTVWEMIGYLMYSGNPLHKAVMLCGDGRNGKGTLLDILNQMLGKANVTSVSLHDLVNTRFSSASLFGKLANIAGDIDSKYLESTATFKAITGGDQVSAEHKGKDRFDFTPWAVPVFSANEVPASVDATVGYLSRWLVIPFPNSFVGREDRHLKERLATELAGIGAKGIRYLAPLLERGNFRASDSGQEAMMKFERKVDQVRSWLAECTESGDPDQLIRRTYLYDCYKQWCSRDGMKPLSAQRFYSRLDGAGCHPHVRQGVRGYLGLVVTDSGTWHPEPYRGTGWSPD